MRPVRPRRLTAATGLLTVLGMAVSLTAVTGQAVTANATPASASGGRTPPPAGTTLPPTPEGAIRITQANLLSGQPDARFAADANSVIAGHPDFITYNEVPYRPDAVLAPPGYALFRTPGKYAGETPVAWRTDRWTPINQGTAMVNNRPGRLPGQKVEWGIRYANWVTLQGADGQVISVISAHLPPITSLTEGLQAEGLANIDVLADQLATVGPVLMAGDMNFNYRGPAQYPAELLAGFDLTPTYDLLGTHFPTGDHLGATIDYIFLRSATQFQTLAHYATELYSDHDAVTADLMLAAAPVPAVTFPAGSYTNAQPEASASRRSVNDLLIDIVDNTPARAQLRLTTTKLADKALIEAIRNAADRKVRVNLVVRRPNLKPVEEALLAQLGKNVRGKRWGRPCLEVCRKIESRGKLPQTRLTVETAGATQWLTVDVDKPLVFGSTKVLTTAKVETRKGRYKTASRWFDKLVER